MSAELATVVLFGGFIGLIALGLPLVFSLGSVAVIGTYFLWGPQALAMVALRTFSSANSFVLIAVPLFFPLARSLGFDPVWFGVLFVVNMEMAYLTPPFGFNLFFMRAVAPPSVCMGDIYRGVIPFVAMQAVGLALMMVFPEIITTLPRAVL